MKRGILFLAFIIFLISISFVTAEVQVLNKIEEIYNINEKIPLELRINYKESLSGYVKSNVECNNKTLDYYIAPVQFRTTDQVLNIPALTFTEKMLGRCSLNIIFLDLDNNLLEKQTLKVIEVSDKIKLSSFFKILN